MEQWLSYGLYTHAIPYLHVSIYTRAWKSIIGRVGASARWISIYLDVCWTVLNAHACATGKLKPHCKFKGI